MLFDLSMGILVERPWTPLDTMGKTCLHARPSGSPEEVPNLNAGIPYGKAQSKPNPPYNLLHVFKTPFLHALKQLVEIIRHEFFRDITHFTDKNKFSTPCNCFTITKTYSFWVF